MIDSSLEEYRKINSILERDSTDTTYKFALLRGAIEVCEKYQHLGKEDDDKIWFPMGLLVEKWIFYYYPLLANEPFIPQKSGEKPNGSSQSRMTFSLLLTEIIRYYKDAGGDLSGFHDDYERGALPDEIKTTFLALCTNIRDTISKMPMKHLGYSSSRTHYSVFEYKPRKGPHFSSDVIDRDLLIQDYGEYSITRTMNTVFLYFGGFISGENTLLLKWAQFSNARSEGKISIGDAMEVLSRLPESGRDVREAEKFYRSLWDKKKEVKCVWSGVSIKSLEECNIDHLLPFAVWQNNELWNLMPATPEANNKKSDKIPSDELLEKRKDAILEYWDLMMKYNPTIFEKEIRISLTGQSMDGESWKELAFTALKQKCEYLIKIRGYTEWNYNL